MKKQIKPALVQGVTRRGFLKAVLPGMFAAGVVAAAGARPAPESGAYGNGPYGGAPAQGGK